MDGTKDERRRRLEGLAQVQIAKGADRGSLIVFLRSSGAAPCEAEEIAESALKQDLRFRLGPDAPDAFSPLHIRVAIASTVIGLVLAGLVILFG